MSQQALRVEMRATFRSEHPRRGEPARPLSWWIERSSGAALADAPDLNELSSFHLSVSPSTTASLFDYTAGCADAMARQFDAANQELASDGLALITQAILGVPQCYVLALVPDGPTVRLSAVLLEDQLQADSACVYPGLANAADVDTLYESSRAALSGLMPSGAAHFEYRDIPVPRAALCAALAREAQRVDQSYAAYAIVPRAMPY